MLCLGQLTSFTLQCAIFPPLKILHSTFVDIESNDGSFSSKFNCKREADVPQTNHGDEFI